MNDFDEENLEIDYDKLKEVIIDNLGNLYSVDEAILEKSCKDEYEKGTFELLDLSHKYVKDYTNYNITKLNLIKLETKLFKIVCFLINNKRLYLIDEVNDEINITKEELKEIKNILSSIKKAIKELKKYNTAICNLQLYELIDLLLTKENIILSLLTEYLEKSRLSINNIKYISSNKNQESLSETNNKINESIKILGLKI